MRQVLMQRGNHIFIRYCAGESVFAGFRRIAKLATSIAIAVAFTGIALPTSSAQAQTATLAATGNPSISDGEETTFTLTLDNLPTDRNITHATVTLIVRGDNPLLDHPSSTGYEGASFDVIVTGDNNRAVTLNRQSGTGRIQKRMSVTIPLDPTSSTLGAGQPAVITYTVRGKSVLSDQSFSLATFAKSFSFRDNNSNFELSDLAVRGSPQPFTVTASDDLVLLTYGYPDGATIPNFKTEAPASYTGAGGNSFSPGSTLSLTFGVAAHYADGTVYQCAESSPSNCVINLGGLSGAIGRIAAGGPVYVTALGVQPTAVSAIAAADAAEGDDIDVTITLNQRLPLTASGVGRVAYAVAGRGASPIDPAADVTVASPATFSADGTGPTLTFTIAANVDNLVEGDETGTVTVTEITWSGDNNLTGLSESADFAVSDVALPPPVAEPQDPLLIYTYENLAVIPDHLFKSEEPTNASSAGITWTEDVSVAITHNATATYSDGTTYECLSSGGCVITFVSRQIDSGGQVRISQPFEIGSQQFIPAASARIQFPGGTAIPSAGESRSGNVVARSIVENQGTGVGQGNSMVGISTYQVFPSGFPGNVTAAECVYGLGGDALYLGEDTGDVNTGAGDYALIDDRTPIALTDSRFSLPEERDADVNHLFTDACGPGVTSPTRIRITPDTVDEPNEVIGIVLKRVTLFIGGQELGSARVSEPDALAITITDDDDPTIPEVMAVAATVAEATEAGTAATITVTFAAAVTTDLVLDYGIFGGDSFTDDNKGLTAADITSIAIAPGNPGDVASNSTSNLTEIINCADIRDLRCGTLTFNGSNSFVITITADNDAIPELNEEFTFFLRGRPVGAPPPDNDRDGVFDFPDQRESNVLFPNFGALADRSARISITDDDSAPTGLAAAIPGDTVLTEGGTLNNIFTLSSATTATLGYRITGLTEEDIISKEDISIAAGGGNAVNTTTVTPNVDDPRKGTFTVTGTTGTSGSLTFSAPTDNILEGTESFTLTLFAGNPDDTSLTLGTNGTKNYTLDDTTDATARLTWPGTTTRTGGEQRDSRGDASSPIGESEFPGGVLEGASPHVLLDLHVTGTPGTPVTVGRDLFFPITCRRMTGTSTFSTPNCGPLGLDIRIESINDDKGTRARSDDTIVHGFFVRAGRSQEATGINTVPDSNSREPDETFVFNTDDPIEFRGRTPDARVTPFATDASLTVHDRPVDAGDITWVPEDPAQADFGAGLTKIADLVITLPGGFTADHSAVTVDYTYNGSDALGSISFRDPDNTSTIYATREVILRNEDDDVIGTRERITVVRTSFSKADPGSDPTATVGLYFSPAASGSGERPTVDIKKVSHADLLTVSFDRDLCNDGLPGAAPGSDPCANQQFGVGVPMVEFPSAGRVLAASEAGPVVGSVPFRIFTSSTPEENFFPDSVDATIGFTLGGTARRGLSPNSRDYVLSVLRSDNADGTGNPADITPAFTSANAGTVPLADGNRAQYVIFRVTPNADGINEGTETVEIRVSDVTFSDDGTTTDIPVNRGQTITIANAPVAVMQLSSSDTFLLLVGAENPDAPVRTGRNNDDIRGNDERFNIPSVRLRVTPAPGETDFPEEAFYATIAYTVDPASTATHGVGEDYTIARETSVASEPTPVGGLGTSSSFTLSRDSTDAGQQIRRSTGISNLDFWLNINDDSIVEPPETVIMNFTTTLFACASGLNGAKTACTGGQAETPLGPPIPFTLSFLINDNDGVAITGVRTTPPVVNEDARNSADRRVLVELLGNFDSRIVINRDVEIDYNITDASGGAITDNTLGVTAADFTIPDQIRNNRGASDCTTARLSQDERDAGVIICRGTITAIGNTNQHIEIDIVDDDDGENEEAFYVNFEAKTVATGAGEREIVAGTRALVTIADSDGGGPPPILGPTAALATTGSSSIVNNTGDDGATTLTLQLTNIPTNQSIATARATLAFGNTPGFSDATSNVVTGTNYNVSVAIAAGSLADDATTLDGDNIIVEFPFTGGDAPVLTYTIAANDVNESLLDPTYDFSVSMGVEFLDSAGPDVVTLDPPGLTERGSPQTLRIVEPPAPPGVSIEARDPIAVEANPATTDIGSYRITLTPPSTTSDTVVNFTVSTTGTANATGGNCDGTRGTISASGDCVPGSGGLAPVDTIDYFIATRTGAGTVGNPYAYAPVRLASDSNITIPMNAPFVDLFLLPVLNSAGDVSSETATITIGTGTGYDVAASPNNAATVTIVDPGTAELELVTGHSALAIGGRNDYSVNLDDIGVEDPAGRANADPVFNRIGGDLIDAVFELRFRSNPNFGPLPAIADLVGDPVLGTNAITGDNYDVFLRSGPIDDPANYDISLSGNVLRVVVKQSRLTGPGASGGSAPGGERFIFSVIPKGVVGSTTIDLVDAYTVLAGSVDVTDEDNQRDTLNTSASGNTFSAVDAPTATLDRVSGFDGTIPTTADTNALALSFVNPLPEIFDSEFAYTLSITPTGADAVNTPFAGHFEITAPAANVTVSEITEDGDARTVTITDSRRDALDTLTDSADAFVALRALPFTGGNRTFNIALTNVSVVSGSGTVTRINATPSNDIAERQTTVSVAAFTGPTASINVTGPQTIELGDSAAGGADTTTFDVVLENIPAVDTNSDPVNIVRFTLDFAGTTATDPVDGDPDESIIADSANNSASTLYYTVVGMDGATVTTPSTPDETVTFQYDDDAAGVDFVDGNGVRRTTFPFTLFSDDASTGVIVVKVSAISYFQADPSMGNAVTTPTVQLLDDDTDALNLAARTIATVATGGAPSVNLVAETANDNIISEGGEADFTVDLNNIPTVVASSTATFVDVEISADTANGSLSFNRASGDGTITMGGAGEFTLTPPTTPAAVFINSSDNSETAVLRMPITTGGDNNAIITIDAGSNLATADPFISLAPTGISWRMGTDGADAITGGPAVHRAGRQQFLVDTVTAAARIEAVDENGDVLSGERQLSTPIGTDGVFAVTLEGYNLINANGADIDHVRLSLGFNDGSSVPAPVPLTTPVAGTPRTYDSATLDVTFSNNIPTDAITASVTNAVLLDIPREVFVGGDGNGRERVIYTVSTDDATAQNYSAGVTTARSRLASDAAVEDGRPPAGSRSLTLSVVEPFGATLEVASGTSIAESVSDTVADFVIAGIPPRANRPEETTAMRASFVISSTVNGSRVPLDSDGNLANFEWELIRDVDALPEEFRATPTADICIPLIGNEATSRWDVAINREAAGDIWVGNELVTIAVTGISYLESGDCESNPISEVPDIPALTATNTVSLPPDDDATGAAGFTANFGTISPAVADISENTSAITIPITYANPPTMIGTAQTSPTGTSITLTFAGDAAFGTEYAAKFTVGGTDVPINSATGTHSLGAVLVSQNVNLVITPVDNDADSGDERVLVTLNGVHLYNTGDGTAAATTNSAATIGENEAVFFLQDTVVPAPSFMDGEYEYTVVGANSGSNAFLQVNFPEIFGASDSDTTNILPGVGAVADLVLVYEGHGAGFFSARTCDEERNYSPGDTIPVSQLDGCDDPGSGGNTREGLGINVLPGTEVRFRLRNAAGLDSDLITVTINHPSTFNVSAGRSPPALNAILTELGLPTGTTTISRNLLASISTLRVVGATQTGANELQASDLADLAHVTTLVIEEHASDPITSLPAGYLNSPLESLTTLTLPSTYQKAFMGFSPASAPIEPGGVTRISLQLRNEANTASVSPPVVIIAELDHTDNLSLLRAATGSIEGRRSLFPRFTPGGNTAAYIGYDATHTGAANGMVEIVTASLAVEQTTTGTGQNDRSGVLDALVETGNANGLSRTITLDASTAPARSPRAVLTTDDPSEIPVGATATFDLTLENMPSCRNIGDVNRYLTDSACTDAGGVVLTGHTIGMEFPALTFAPPFSTSTDTGPYTGDVDDDGTDDVEVSVGIFDSTARVINTILLEFSVATGDLDARGGITIPVTFTALAATDGTALAETDGEFTVAFPDSRIFPSPQADSIVASRYYSGQQDNAYLTFTAQGSADLSFNQNGNEGTPTNGEFSLAFRGAPVADTTINYLIPTGDDNAAIPGVDYSLDGGTNVTVDPDPPVVNASGDYIGTIRIAAAAFASNGNADITISAVPINDDIVEGPETVTLTFPDGVPGVSYTADDPAIEVEIADDDTALVLIGVNSQVLTTGTNQVSDIREGLTYPVQLFIKDGTTTTINDAALLSATNNVVLSADATFTLTLSNMDLSNGADVTIAGGGADVSFSDSAGNNLSDTATIMIPAGQFTGLAHLTIRDDADDTLPNEVFEVDITEGAAQPVYSFNGDDFRAAVTIRPTSGGGIIIANEARADFCAGRTPAVANAIRDLVQSGSSTAYNGILRPAAECDVTDLELEGILMLDLSGVSPDLTSLQPGDFAGLDNLTTLGLNSNNIRALPADVFPADLANVTSLTLAGNELINSHDSIPEDVFDNLAALTTLNLGNMSTLTGLPDNVLNDVLDTLTTLTIDDAAQRFVTFAEPNEYEIVQDGETTVRLRITNTAGQTAATPTAVFVTLETTGSGLTVPVAVTEPGSVSRNGIIIPAGSNGVDVTISADDDAANPATDTPAMLSFSATGAETLLGTYDETTFTTSSRRPGLITLTANSASDPISAEVNIVAPVQMMASDAAAAVRDNEPGAIDLTLNRRDADVGTVDVSFELSGGLAVGVDYTLDITRPDDSEDGAPVRIGGAGNGLTGEPFTLADSATTGIFRLPDGASSATFTITPIASRPLRTANSSVIIQITEVDYNGGEAPDAVSQTPRPSATVGVTAYNPAPAVAITLSSEDTTNDGANGVNTQITEGLGGDDQGTFTISLSDLPQGRDAVVSYSLTVQVQADDLAFSDSSSAITGVSIGAVATDTSSDPSVFEFEGDAPTSGAAETFTVTIPSGEDEAMVDLRFSARAGDGDTDSETVTLTINEVTFTDIGDGTDITAPVSGAIEINDSDPVFNICSRTDAVETAILAAVHVFSPGVQCDAVTTTTGHLSDARFTSLTVTGVPSLRPDDFAGLTALTTLSLTGTFSSLPAGVFDDNDELINLTLDGSVSGVIPAVFDNLVNLVTLDLSDNALSGIIANNAFDELVLLQTLDLSGNNITTTTDAGVFADLAALTTLRLGPGNTSLSLLNGSLNGVLDTLTTLTYPAERLATATFSSDPVSVERNVPTTFGVQLDNSLPVDVRIPVTTAADGVTVDATVLIPATTNSNTAVQVDISATATAALAGGTLELGTPELGIIDSGTFALIPRAGNAAIPVGVRTVIIADPTDTATLAVTEPAAPAVTLTADTNNAASEINNVTGTADLALNFGGSTLSEDIADVTFTLTGSADIGVDYNLAITDSDGTAVDKPNDGTFTANTDRIFRIPAGKAPATFTVTPIANTPNTEGEETVTITITGIVFAAAQDYTGTDSADIAIADYATLPMVTVDTNSELNDDNIVSGDDTNDDTGTFTIGLSGAPNGTATLSYSLVVTGDSVSATDIDPDFGTGTTRVGSMTLPIVNGDGTDRFTMEVASGTATGMISFTANADADNDDETVTLTILGVTFDDTGTGTNIITSTDNRIFINDVDNTAPSSVTSIAITAADGTDGDDDTPNDAGVGEVGEGDNIVVTVTLNRSVPNGEIATVEFSFAGTGTAPLVDADLTRTGLTASTSGTGEYKVDITGDGGDNDTSVEISIPVFDDVLIEGSEMGLITINRVTFSGTTPDITPTVGNTAAFTILDNDNVQIDEFTTAVTLTEDDTDTDGTSMDLTVTLLAGANIDVEIPYTISDVADLTAPASATGMITVLATETTGTLTLTARNDDFIEAPETITVTLSPSTANVTVDVGLPDSELVLSGGSPQSTVTINDVDTLTVALASTPYAFTEGGTNNAVVSASGGILTADVTVTLTASAEAGDTAAVPADVAAMATLLIPAQSSGGVDINYPTAQPLNVPIAVVEDTAAEGAETFTLTLTTTSELATLGTPVTAAATIAASDVASMSLVAAESPIYEGGRSVVTLTLNAPAPAGGITVPYTTTAGTTATSTDFNITPANFNVLEGEMSADITVMALVDAATSEPNETVRITLTAGNYGGVEVTALTADVEIIDGTGPTATLTGSSRDLTRGRMASFSVVLEGVAPSLIPGFAHVKVVLGLGGTADRIASASTTVPTSGGLQTADYSLDITSSNVGTLVHTAVAFDGNASTPPTLTFYVPASNFSDSDSTETVMLQLSIKNAASTTDNIRVSIMEAVAVNAAPALADILPTGDFSEGTATLTYSVVAPARLAPVTADIVEGSSQPITLTLENPATGTFTIPYTVTPINGAVAADYEITGSFAFVSGATTATISVQAVDDSIEDEGGEGLTITLDDGDINGAPITSADDPIRSTLTIIDRVVVPEEVMQQVETVATVVATEHVSALTSLIRQRFSATSSFASPPRVPTGGIPAPSTNTNLSLSDNPENMNDMINSMGLESSAQGDSNDHYAVWIRGQRSAFEGTPEVQGLTVNYDGTSTGFGLGAEYISGGYLMGLAMNFVSTEVDLSTEGGEGSESITKYDESIVIAAPYISLKASEGTSMWASAGFGSGTADAKLSGETKSADVSLSFLNAGADFTVIGRGFEVVTGLSGLIVRKVVDAFAFADAVIPETTIDTMQGVGEITVYRSIHIAGQIVRPYLGVSSIHDFGDIVADDDHGLGIRTGVAFGIGRISADIELSSELLRENRRQWTVSGGARFASRPGGQGLSLSLDGTQETLMDTDDAADDNDQTWGIGLEGGYGMPAGLFHPDGVLTPFASIDQAGDGRDMSGGVRFSVGNGLSLDLETTRQMHDDSEDASEHKAGLRGRWSF